MKTTENKIIQLIQNRNFSTFSILNDNIYHQCRVNTFLKAEILETVNRLFIGP